MRLEEHAVLKWVVLRKNKEIAMGKVDDLDLVLPRRRFVFSLFIENRGRVGKGFLLSGIS